MLQEVEAVCTHISLTAHLLLPVRNLTAPPLAHPINYAAHQGKSRSLAAMGVCEHTSQQKTGTSKLAAHDSSDENDHADTRYRSIRHGDVPAPESIPVKIGG
ncbi:MAG: hypothetical protein LC676_09245 [Loktanella sp.]|nr:hypothetical protein [Loktanella sp.]